MANPFKYGSIVSEDAFCNRESEQHDLKEAIENGQKLFLYGERRLGKTSLIKEVLRQLPPKRYIAAYVDLFPTLDEASFVRRTANALGDSARSTYEKMGDFVGKVFEKLRPTLTVDPASGQVTINLGLSNRDEELAAIEHVLEAPQKAADLTGKRVVVVFDEFQKITEYEDATIESKIRSVIQMQEEICYIFMGSREQLIKEMFLNKSRALYKSAKHYPLKTIEYEHWEPFIIEKFERERKQISQREVHEIFRLTEGHPFYTQHLCAEIWDICPAGEKVSMELIADSVRVLLDKESFAYVSLWETLTSAQRNTLVGFAMEHTDIKPFSSAFIQKYKLGTASKVQAALDALIEKDIIERENGTYIINDRFFKIWINRLYEDSA